MLKLGVIGAGLFTNRILLPAYANSSKLDVVAIADLDSDAVTSTAKKFGIDHSFTDPYALLRSNLIDAVHICVPPVHAPDITEAAINCGLHIICEKPIATSVERAHELTNQAKKAGLIVAVDHEQRFDPAMKLIRQLVTDEFIGEPRLLNVNAILNVGINSESPLRFHSWYDQHSLGGGISQMVLSHIVDLTRYIFGDFCLLSHESRMLMASKPESKNSDAQIPCAADDVTVLLGQLPSGGLAVLSGGWVLSHGGGMRWDIRGSEGTIILDRDGTLYGGKSDSPIEILSKEDSDRSIVSSLKSTEEWFALILAQGYEFADAVSGSPGPFNFSTFKDGVRVLESVTSAGAKFDTASAA